jgi:hypothetical protein
MKKQEIINEIQKYPEYAAPSRKYLHTLSEKDLGKVLMVLESIFKKTDEGKKKLKKVI